MMLSVDDLRGSAYERGRMMEIKTRERVREVSFIIPILLFTMNRAGETAW